MLKNDWANLKIGLTFVYWLGKSTWSQNWFEVAACQPNVQMPIMSYPGKWKRIPALFELPTYCTQTYTQSRCCVGCLILGCVPKSNLHPSLKPAFPMSLASRSVQEINCTSCECRFHNHRPLTSTAWQAVKRDKKMWKSCTSLNSRYFVPLAVGTWRHFKMLSCASMGSL